MRYFKIIAQDGHVFWLSDKAYRRWNSGYSDNSDNPVKMLKWFTAMNFYVLPKEDSNVDKNSADNGTAREQPDEA